MAISFVRCTSNSLNSDPGTTIAAPAQNHTAGNLIVVVAYGYDAGGHSPTVTGIADTASNTYSVAIYVRAAWYCIEIWYAYNITGNANNVVTTSFSTSVIYRICGPHEYSGALTTASVFDSSQTGIGSGTSMTTAAASTGYANEMMLAFYSINQIPVFTAGAGFTLRQGFFLAQSEDDTDLGAAGSYSSAMTSGTSGDWTGLHATFRVAGGGATASVSETLNFAEALD